MPARLKRVIGVYNDRQFVALLVLITALAFLIAASGDLAAPGSPAGYALLAIQATMLVNVASHIGAAIVLRGYAPGLVTALALNLPFSLWLLHVASAGHWYSAAALLWLIPLALILHGPVLIGLLKAAARLPLA